MANNKIQILTLSGCLTKEAIVAWREGSISRSDIYMIKQHLDDCPFCKEALEGYSLLAPQQVQNNFNQISDRFNKTILTEEKKTKTLSKKLLIGSAAAIILAFIGIYSVFKFLPNYKAAPVAQNMETESKQKPALEKNSNQTMSETAPAIANKIAPNQPNKPSDKPEQTYIADDIAEMPAPVIMDTEPDQMEEAVIAEALPAEEEKFIYKEESAVYASNPKINEKKSEQAAKANKPALSKRSSSADAVMPPLEKPAQFQNGDINKFKTYLEEKLALAIQDKKATPGNITVSFIVDARGKVQNIVIVKGIDNKTNSTITEIIQNSPKWTPAQQNNKNVESKQVLTLVGK